MNEEDYIKARDDNETRHYLRYQHSPIEAGNPFEKGADWAREYAKKEYEDKIHFLKSISETANHNKELASKKIQSLEELLNNVDIIISNSVSDLSKMHERIKDLRDKK